MINDQGLRVLLTEAVSASIRRVPVPSVRPGTVTDSDGPMVLIDGDTASVEVPSLVGPVPPGQRVMVLFHPPAGALIIGPIGNGLHRPACVLSGTTSVGHTTLVNAQFTADEYDPFGWHTAATDIVPTISGMFALSIAADWQVVADYTRVYVSPVINGANVAAPLDRSDQSFASAAAFNPRSIGVAPPWLALNAGDTLNVQLHHTNVAAATRSANVRVSLEWKAPLP